MILVCDICDIFHHSVHLGSDMIYRCAVCSAIARNGKWHKRHKKIIMDPIRPIGDENGSCDHVHLDTVIDRTIQLENAGYPRGGRRGYIPRGQRK